MDDYEELRAAVGSVLAPEAFDRWMETPIPAFGNRTPSAMIFDGHLDLVLERARSYSNPSYG